MELGDGDFERLMPNVSEELRQTMQRTYRALQRSWEQREQDAAKVYQIVIPAQTLTIYGETQAQHVLRTLRSVKVSGTYRVSKGGSNEGS